MANYFETADLPLAAANFDYFRLAPEKWPLLLTRLAQLGLSNLIIPVPWGFHHLHQNTVDLTGETNPRRNLSLLLKLCAGLNFRCVVQPGPFLPDYGVLNDGLPLWLAETGGEPIEAAAEGWLATLARALSEAQWPDGPVVALWLTFQQDGDTSPLANPQLTDVKWPIWLRKRYQGIDALNAAYGTHFRTVNEVQFPQHWSDSPTPLEEDARAFLDEVEHAHQNRFQQALAGAGWQGPVYPFDPLPAIEPFSDRLPTEPAIIALAAPLHIDPCPPDICRGLTWAEDAPIRSDGSLRENFWPIRRQIWPTNRSTAAAQIGAGLAITFENGGLILPGGPTDLKLNLPAGQKPATFQLNVDGSLQEETVRVFRGKLRGEFKIGSQPEQADLVFYLTDPSAPLTGPLNDYLRILLTAQKLSLIWSAAQAKKLSQALTAKPDSGTPPQSRPAAASPYTIAEARRGLSRAEAALKKAMASIGGLEAGFDTILGDRQPASSQPVPEAAVVSAEVFDAAVRPKLAELGEDCAVVIDRLKSAAKQLQERLANPLTLVEYRQARQDAVDAARSAIDSLLVVIEQLRLEIAGEQLPLVAWRLHDQAQTIAETLRWGVLHR